MVHAGARARALVRARARCLPGHWCARARARCLPGRWCARCLPGRLRALPAKALVRARARAACQGAGVRARAACQGAGARARSACQGAGARARDMPARVLVRARARAACQGDARPLCHLQYPVAYLSRLQRILPAARWELRFKASHRANPPCEGRQRHVPLGGRGPLLLVGKRTTGARVASSPDSDLEAFSHNPTHGSFAPLAFQPSAMTNCANQRFLSY
ncbi:hypothetical protein VNO78_30373 [Psophocarpus tetragonolobus]|uniref:Uncharacterized protein n=1 Tax=Psophocarpus tetragonolobus TaxID=3891 RepID=A0AAN9X4S9_PSOTE